VTVAENAASIEALEARVAKLEMLNNPTQYVSQVEAKVDSYLVQLQALTVRIQEMESGKGQDG